MMPILLLAAGSSSRMRGADKLLQKIDNVPLLYRQTQMALRVSDDVRVALPPRPHPRYGVLKGLPVRLVEVTEAAEGLGASLRTVMATLDDATHAMVLLADLPDITDEDLRTIIRATRTEPDALIWRGATADGQGGHPMIFESSLFQEFARLKGDTGGQDIVRSAGNRVCLVPLPGNRALLDLDTPEDWAAWRAGKVR